MKKYIAMFLVAMFLLPVAAFLHAQEKAEDEVIAVAINAVSVGDMELKEVDIIYDEGGKLWNERIGYLAGEDQSPNHGILRRGFLKNYKIVYFDFQEPLTDIWVFVDKDTGEVFEVYKESI